MEGRPEVKVTPRLPEHCLDLLAARPPAPPSLSKMKDDMYQTKWSHSLRKSEVTADLTVVDSSHLTAATVVRTSTPPTSPDGHPCWTRMKSHPRLLNYLLPAHCHFSPFSSSQGQKAHLLLNKESRGLEQYLFINPSFTYEVNNQRQIASNSHIASVLC